MDRRIEAVVLAGLITMAACERVNTNDLDSTGRPFAEAALSNNFSAMINLLAPSTRGQLENPGIRKFFEDANWIYFCSRGGIKLTSDPAKLKEDTKENITYATYKMQEPCKKRVNYLSSTLVDTNEITVMFEKVHADGKDKYYPIGLR